MPPISPESARDEPLSSILHPIKRIGEIVTLASEFPDSTLGMGLGGFAITRRGLVRLATEYEVTQQSWIRTQQPSMDAQE
jgi:hypothetical protein